MRTAASRNVLALLAVVLLVTTTAHAESVVWNTQKTVTLYTPLAVAYWYDYFGENLGSIWYPNITIQYSARVANADTGAIIPCGSTVPVGTNLSFDFIPHEYTDVYWFAAGWGFDSPYGEWRKGASSPPTVSCEDKDFVGTNVGDRNGQAFTYYIYSALVVAPPSKHVDGVEAMSCGTPDENGSVDCTANTAGTFISKFDFGPTTGKFYGRLWSPPYFTYIPRSRHDPKILWVDDAEIVGDRITKVRPIPRNLFTQKTERRIGELGASCVALVVSDVSVHEAP